MATTTRSAHVDAGPDEVFATLTDPARLPHWNHAVRRVVDAPTTLSSGDQWVVELHVLGRTWHSRSRVEALDPVARVFAHRSQTDDGNPSYALWRWTVTSEPDGGSLVTVTFELQPRTFWRKALFVHVRRHQLAAQELPRSLAALAVASKTSVAGG
jgi:uncharacterized protein YndB with AHSA1/START domain